MATPRSRARRSRSRWSARKPKPPPLESIAGCSPGRGLCLVCRAARPGACCRRACSVTIARRRRPPTSRRSRVRSAGARRGRRPAASDTSGAGSLPPPLLGSHREGARPARPGAAIGPGAARRPPRDRARAAPRIAVRSRRAVFIALPFAGRRCSYPCTGLCCATLCVVLAPSARSRGVRWRSASPLHWCGTAFGCARRWCRRSRGRRPPRSLSQPTAPRCATRGSTRSRCGRTSPTSTCPTTTRRRSCAE